MITLNIAFGSYPVSSSMFQLIERPLYALNSKYNADYARQTSRHAHSTNNNSNFQQITTIGLSTLFTPFILCATPVTMIADGLIGLGEAAHAIVKGYSSEQVRLIIQKKLIAAQFQQLTFLVVNLLAIGLIGGTAFFINTTLGMKMVGVITVGSMTSLFVYQSIQSTIGSKSFPSWAKPDGFNIFINGGAPSELGYLYIDSEKYMEEEYSRYKKCREEYERTQSSKKAHSSATSSNDPWKIYVETNTQTLTRATDESNFSALLNKFIDGKPPQELLGLNEGFNAQDLKRAYKKNALIAHPDKKSDKDKPAAEILFKAVCEANYILEKHVAI
jgi:hypothetical protein